MNREVDSSPQPFEASLPLSQTRPFYWSVNRELWENRSIYIAPAAVAVVVLVAALIATICASTGICTGSAAAAAQNRVAVVRPFSFAPAPIMFSTLIVAIFYCLDALYGERRDRSILFWKSLPVSDRTTVLAKASIPFVVLPLIAYVLSIAAQVILLVVSTPVLLANGVGGLWPQVDFFEGLVVMAYGLAVHALWFAPLYGWLLFVSAWARRTPVLWAFVPMFAISILERIAFEVAKSIDSAAQFQPVVGGRWTGAMRVAFDPESNGNVNHLSQLTPLNFLSTPGLWLGLILGAAFIAMAIRLRRNREPI